MALNFNNEINQLQKTPIIGRYLSVALQGIQDGVNKLATNLAADASDATVPAPPAIQSLNVKTDGNGNVHAVISDAAGNIQRGINYFVEYDTTPNFSQPHVVHLNATRTMSPIGLPAKDDNNNDQLFYFRAYSQYRGGAPGPKINFGGNTPTSVNPGGAGKATLLPSTGSGTAQNTGQQGGSGLGTVQTRKQT
jgi:hypothetical protein